MKKQIGIEKVSAKLDRSSVTHTTCNVGDVQPFMFRTLLAHEKMTVNSYALVRALPIKVPSSAGLEFKQFYKAIPINEVYNPYQSLRSGLPYAFTNDTRIINSMPTVDVNALFLYLIACCDYNATAVIGNVYVDNNGNFVDESVDLTPYVVGTQNTAHTQTNFKSRALLSHDILDDIDASSGYSDLLMRYFAKCLLNTSTMEIPRDAFINEAPQEINAFSGCDVFVGNIYRGTFNVGASFRFNGVGIRLGEFGQKLRKLFIGLGYNIDSILSPEGCSTITYKNSNIMPFVAYAKAIYDTFAIQRFADYQHSCIGRFIALLNGISNYSDDYAPKVEADYNNIPAPIWTSTVQTQFVQLALVIQECMFNSFYVLDLDSNTFGNDSVGQITLRDNINISTAVEGRGSYEGIARATTNSVTMDNWAFTNLHNLASKLLRFVNTDNVVGASVYKWLEKYGIHVDNQHTAHYSVIGRDVMDLNIHEITNLAQSADMPLGDYAGKSVQERKFNKTVVYTANDEAYFFAYGCIVPRIGYYQGINPEYFRKKRFERFIEEFDSMGYVPHNSALVHGATDSVNMVVPRYMDYKQPSQDVVNGDMSRRSLRADYSPYYYQRDIWFDRLTNLNNGSLLLSDTFRKIGFDKSLGNFLKIFNNDSMLYDHFIVDLSYNCVSHAPCKPIAESWDTVDTESNQGSTYVTV